MTKSGGLAAGPPLQPVQPPLEKVSKFLSLLLVSNCLGFVTRKRGVLTAPEVESLTTRLSNEQRGDGPKLKDHPVVKDIDCFLSATTALMRANRLWETWVGLDGVKRLRQEIKDGARGLVWGELLGQRVTAALAPLSLILTYSTCIPLRALALSALQGIAEEVFSADPREAAALTVPVLSLLADTARVEARHELRFEADQAAVGILDGLIARSGVQSVPRDAIVLAVAVMDAMLSAAEERAVVLGLSTAARWLSLPVFLGDDPGALHPVVASHLARLARARSTHIAEAALGLIPLLDRRHHPALDDEASLALLIGDYAPGTLALLGQHLVWRGKECEQGLLGALCPPGSSFWFSNSGVRVSREGAARRIVQYCKPPAESLWPVLEPLLQPGADLDMRSRALLAVSVAIEMKMAAPAGVAGALPATDPETAEAVLDWVLHSPPGDQYGLSEASVVTLMKAGVEGGVHLTLEDRFRDMFVVALRVAIAGGVKVSLAELLPATLEPSQAKFLLCCGPELLALARGGVAEGTAFVVSLAEPLVSSHSARVGSEKPVLDPCAIDDSLRAIAVGLESILAAKGHWKPELIKGACELAKSHRLLSFHVHLAAAVARHRPDQKQLVQTLLADVPPVRVEPKADSPAPHPVPFDLRDVRVLADLLLGHPAHLSLSHIGPHLAPLVATCADGGYPRRVEEIKATWLELTKAYSKKEVREAETLAIHWAADGLQLTRLVEWVLLPARLDRNMGIENIVKEFVLGMAGRHGVKENTSIQRYIGLKSRR